MQPEAVSAAGENRIGELRLRMSGGEEIRFVDARYRDVASRTRNCRCTGLRQKLQESLRAKPHERPQSYSVTLKLIGEKAGS